MRYKTGEAAALLDMTKEGLRFLTRKGVIGCERDEKNRYRSFERDCITMLQRIRCWQKLGFSLEQSFQITYVMGIDGVREELDKKAALLEEEIKGLQYSLDLIHESAERLSKLREGERRWIEKHPAMVFFPSCGENGSDPHDCIRLKAEGLWGTSRPDVLPARIVGGGKGARQEISGYAAKAASAEAAKLPADDGLISFPEQLCYMEQILLEKNDQPDYDGMLTRIEEMGLQQAGDILLTTEFVVPVDPRNYVFHTIRLARIPVRPIHD